MYMDDDVKILLEDDEQNQSDRQVIMDKLIEKYNEHWKGKLSTHIKLLEAAYEYALNTTKNINGDYDTRTNSGTRITTNKTN